MAETLGNRIRKARVVYGMSQAELARRIGVSTVTMNSIELGTVDPRASRIKAIAEVLHVSCDYLLGVTDDERPYAVRRKRRATPVEEEDEATLEVAI